MWLGLTQWSRTWMEQNTDSSLIACELKHWFFLSFHLNWKVSSSYVLSIIFRMETPFGNSNCIINSPGFLASQLYRSWDITFIVTQFICFLWIHAFYGVYGSIPLDLFPGEPWLFESLELKSDFLTLPKI
jgi:hypothetical protein